MNQRTEYIAERMSDGKTTLGEAMRLADEAGMPRLHPTGIEAVVCYDIAERQQHGINKYGKTVADNPLNLYQWLQHAYEESLDFSVYLKRAMTELANSQSFTVTGIKHLSGEVLLTTDFDEKVGEHLAAGDQVVLLVLKKGGLTVIAWIKDLIRTRTPAEMLQAQLAEAARMRIVYRATEEEAAAYVWMLNNRITRIKLELAQINTTAPQENQ